MSQLKREAQGSTTQSRKERVRIEFIRLKQILTRQTVLQFGLTFTDKKIKIKKKLMFI